MGEKMCLVGFKVDKSALSVGLGSWYLPSPELLFHVLVICGNPLSKDLYLWPYGLDCLSRCIPL